MRTDQRDHTEHVDFQVRTGRQLGLRIHGAISESFSRRGDHESQQEIQPEPEQSDLLYDKFSDLHFKREGLKKFASLIRTALNDLGIAIFSSTASTKRSWSMPKSIPRITPPSWSGWPVTVLTSRTWGKISRTISFPAPSIGSIKNNWTQMNADFQD